MSPLFLLFALFIHQSVFAARTGTYQFQSNGVICSPDFGAPLLEDCNRALVVLANRKYKNDAQRWFVSSLDTSIKEDHEVLPYSASSGMVAVPLFTPCY